VDRTPSQVDAPFGQTATTSDPVAPFDAVAWKRLCHLFESAVGLSPREREGLLRSHGPLEPSVRRTLLRMLDAHDGPNAMDAVSQDLAAFRNKLWGQAGRNL
jgi:hypothetical protein